MSLRYNRIFSFPFLIKVSMGTDRESITPGWEISPVWTRRSGSDLGGGIRANHTSAEKETELILRSTQTLYRSHQNQSDCRTRQRSYVSNEGRPRRCLLMLRDQPSLLSLPDPSLYSPWLDSLAQFVHFLFRLLFHCEMSGKSNGWQTQ